jgi:hypothetical protein
MLFPSATIVAAMVLTSNLGTSPIATRTAEPTFGGAPGSAVASMKNVAGLWAPKKAAKPRPARDDDEREEELLKPRNPTNGGGGGGASKGKRRPIKMDDSAEEEGEDETDEGGDDDDDDKPKVAKRRKRVAEEEEDESPEPLESQPSIIPRLINVGVAPSVIRRSFGFDQAALQGDTGVRLGYQLSLESFPLVTRPNGWYRTLGIGAVYEKEYGDATHDAAGGMFNGYPFSQERLGFDVRFAIPAGDSVIVMPAVGYGRVTADLQRPNPTTPTNCTVASAMDPCFGDVKAAYLSIDLHVRVALSPMFAMSLAGGYLQGVQVARGPNQITVEGAASMKGFHVEAGPTLMLTDWVGLQATATFRRYGYSFTPTTGTSFSYRSAADMYYGVIAGLALFTK